MHFFFKDLCQFCLILLLLAVEKLTYFNTFFLSCCYYLYFNRVKIIVSTNLIYFSFYDSSTRPNELKIVLIISIVWFYEKKRGIISLQLLIIPWTKYEKGGPIISKFVRKFHSHASIIVQKIRFVIWWALKNSPFHKHEVIFDSNSITNNLQNLTPRSYSKSLLFLQIGTLQI